MWPDNPLLKGYAGDAILVEATQRWGPREEPASGLTPSDLQTPAASWATEGGCPVGAGVLHGSVSRSVTLWAVPTRTRGTALRTGTDAPRDSRRTYSARRVFCAFSQEDMNLINCENLN